MNMGRFFLVGDRLYYKNTRLDLFGFALSSAGHVSPVDAGVGGSSSLRPPSLLPTFRLEHVKKMFLATSLMNEFLEIFHHDATHIIHVDACAVPSRKR
ncbi:unnamed protein product [Ectocarpus sp. CCAP 1310/34]|nr:unnamed protein product [Ectocarpus sp. CCAP 1310/34]